MNVSLDSMIVTRMPTVAILKVASTALVKNPTLVTAKCARVTNFIQFRI